MVTRFASSENGNIAILTAIGVSVLAGVSGVAILMAQGNEKQTSVQAGLDAGVLAGTALPYQGTDAERIAAAERAFYFNVDDGEFKASGGEAEFAAGGDVVKPVFTVSNARVEGRATVKAENSLGSVLGISELEVEVGARAEKMASDPVCVLAMNDSSEESLFVYGDAQFNVTNCAVQVNSLDHAGISQDGKKAGAKASQFGVTGSYAGENFEPKPISGSEPVSDPYASLPVPDPGSCINLKGKLANKSYTLDPGTYCGGLNIGAGSDVKLNPGVYIMKDGQFSVGSGASVTGNEVMIALVGKDSYLYLLSNAHVTLTSPDEGTYKNIQVMSDRDVSQSKFEEEWSTVLSGATLEYDGVLYLPEQQFWVSGTAHDAVIKGYSPTMLLVADKIWAQGNAVFELKREDRRGVGLDMGQATFAYGARLVR